MSELKAYNVVATADVNPEVVDILGCTEWFGYDKVEVDKVIAEKDAEIAQLQAMLEERNSQIAKLTQSLEQVKRAARTLRKKMNHWKRKFCEAMAKMCDSEENRLEAISPIFDTDKECWEYNSDYWARWYKRWLELAKKFKPNSTARRVQRITTWKK